MPRGRLADAVSRAASDPPAAAMTVLPREFFARPVTEVAPGLLGCVISHETPDGLVAAVVVETEAYAGDTDPASHAFRGRTDRNAVMFGDPGHAYVYFTYGMHFCVNLVCRPAGQAMAVLLRAGRIVEGADLAAARRSMRSGARAGDQRASGQGDSLGDGQGGGSGGGSGSGGSGGGPGGSAGRRSPADQLASGPARLCQALGIGRAQNGADVCDPAGPLKVLASAEFAVLPAAAIASGPRVGVRDGVEVNWRFWIAGDTSVSAYRPHTPRTRRR
jgi:DNA-3-methyladenine glycosylase